MKDNYIVTHLSVINIYIIVLRVNSVINMWKLIEGFEDKRD